MKKIISLLVLICVLLSISLCNVNATTQKTKAEALSWVESLSGSKVGDGQCVALIRAYYNFLGFSSVAGNGCDYATNTIPSGLGYREKNGVPNQGDVLIYTGGYGHVAICESNNVSWHQNWSGLYVQKVSRAYNKSYTYNNITVTYWGCIHIDFPSSHTHSYTTFAYQWASHPHYNCYKCSCGDVKENTNEPNYVATCASCNKPSKPINLSVSHNITSEDTYFTWSTCTYATSYDLRIFDSSGNSVATILSIGGNSCNYKLGAGKYYFTIASVNSNFSNCYTMSDRYDFTVKDSDYVPVVSKVYNGNVYEVYDQKMSWTEAEKICEYVGGHLVTITSNEENDFVSSIIQDGSKDCYWIGANDSTTEGQMEWCNGESWSFTKWDDGEPNDYQKSEDYASILKSKCWNDLFNYPIKNIGFVLEIEEMSPSNSFTYNGNRYEIYNYGITWTAANQYCINNGGHLVSIGNAEESSAVNSYIDEYNNYWIGASRTNDGWIWSNGEAFSYRNWETGQPDNAYYNTENYVGIWEEKVWNDFRNVPTKDNEKIKGFICEYETIEPISVNLTSTKIGDGKYTINADINNHKNDSISTNVYIALFDNQGKIKSVYCQDLVIEGNSNQTVEKQVLALSDDKIKCYVWDKNMMPLSSRKSILAEPTISDWVLKDSIPTSANISDSKYTYTETSYQESSQTSIEGWELYDSYWNNAESKSFTYASFPSGFDKSNWYYLNWNNSALTSYENQTSKREVTTSQTGYLYYHWCRGDYTYGPINHWVEDTNCTNEHGTFKTFHAYNSTVNYTEASGDGCYKNAYGDACEDSYWWYKFPYYTCNYTDYTKTNKFKKSEQKESVSYPTGENVSNVQEWVKYEINE